MTSPSKFAFRVIIFVALVTISWCVFWFMAHGKIKEGYERFAAQQLQSDSGINCQEPDWSGFPFRHELRCDRARIGQGTEGEIDIPGITLVSMAWDDKHIITQFESPIKLMGPTGSDITLSFDEASVSVKRRDKTLAELDILITNPVMTQIGMPAIPASMAASELEIHARSSGEAGTTADIYAIVDRLTINAKTVSGDGGEVNAALKEKLSSNKRPPNSLPPYGVLNIAVDGAIKNGDLQTFLPLNKWMEHTITLTLHEGLYVEQDQAYGTDGKLYFSETVPPEGVVSLSVADKSNLPGFMAPLMFFAPPQESTLSGFEKGTAYTFQIQDGQFMIGNTPIFNLQTFFASF